MPDTPVTPAVEGQEPAPLAAAPQGQAAQDDPFSKLAARLEKLEAMEKELHAERTAHGRTKAAFKTATGANADKWLDAYTK